MTDVPAGVAHGRITATYASHRIDDTQDPPALIPQTGRAVLTSSAREVRWPGLDEPLGSGQEEIVCPIIKGRLYPPDTKPDALPTDPGVCVVASVQPGAEPDRVQWRARIELDGCTRRLPDKVFEVPAGGIVDLATVVSITSAPGVIPVFSSKDRIRAEAAADRAQAIVDGIAPESGDPGDVLTLDDTGTPAWQPPTGGGGQGRPGLSAYEVALAAGFAGTEADWLESLRGPQGDAGRDVRIEVVSAADGPPADEPGVLYVVVP